MRFSPNLDSIKLCLTLKIVNIGKRFRSWGKKKQDGRNSKRLTEIDDLVIQAR